MLSAPAPAHLILSAQPPARSWPTIPIAAAAPFWPIWPSARPAAAASAAFASLAAAAAAACSQPDVR
eukprot:SAG22_NODE_298_length_12785_cov_5.760129_16_plen_67_part_00